jgi:iron-sulfur cluster assembly accessory protein
MSIETFTPIVGITATESAAKHIKNELQKAPGMQGVRLYLETSGCSGYMYETELVPGPGPEDEKVVAAEGVTVFVPKKDLPILNGTEIDFVTKGLNSMFQFKNPNVTAECGCGESFSIS